MSLQKILVDIGNTNTKIRSGNKDIIIKNNNFNSSLIPEHSAADISCVASNDLLQYFNNPKIIIPKEYKDINFNYPLAELGADRYLSVIAAYNMFLGEKTMIIDVGTFITIELLADKEYFSGGIAPGFNKLKQIHTFAGTTSIKNYELGIKNMLIAYLANAINSIDYENVVITGGGWIALSQDTLALCNNKGRISYEKNLVLTGMKYL